MGQEGMKIRTTEQGNMCEVRLKDRRIMVWRLHDKSWALSFVRPTKPCAGCDDEHDLEHKLYMGKRGRTVMTGLRLSREAMIGVCDAIATLLEMEKKGVEVKGG